MTQEAASVKNVNLIDAGSTTSALLQPTAELHGATMVTPVQES